MKKIIYFLNEDNIFIILILYRCENNEFSKQHFCNNILLSINKQCKI
ncbi:hypothetical protein [Candidatus Phytoplasma solani]|nr:hypothetical protein [Candidatus Phytoplasma solani]